MHIVKHAFFLLCSVLISFSACAQREHAKTPPPQQVNNTPKEDAQQAAARRQWVDSVYVSMNQSERIGQLFMVAAYSGGKNFNQPDIEQLLRKRQIGGLIFMQGGAGRQAALTNRYQQMAHVPLLIGMDAEWGLGMRLDSVINFPRQMLLGATRDSALVFQMGQLIAEQCRRLGVHVNFAPDVDVNNNPNNPVISFRAFGEDKHLVSRLGIAYMNGLQSRGVMACAKHFPGHGDVSVDSHKDLPVISKSKAQLDTLELYPFKQLIKAGVQSVMVAHLSVPALEKEANVPTTLSKNTITGLLKNEMGFEGLIFTDAMNMQGVAKYFPAGEADYRAFMAGCDVLLFSQDVPTSISKINEAVNNGKISQAELERRVKKILRAKYNAGLSEPVQLQVSGATEDLNKQTLAFNNDAARKALTLVRDDNKIWPMLSRPGLKIAYVGVNGQLDKDLQDALKSKWAGIRFYELPKGSGSVPFQQALKGYDVVIVGIHNLPMYPTKTFGLSEVQRNFLTHAAASNNTALALLGNAYAVKLCCKARTLLVGYEDGVWTQKALMDALTGRLQPRGVLPVHTDCLK